MAKQNEIRITSVPLDIKREANNVSDYYGVDFAKLIMPTVVQAVKAFPKEAREFQKISLHEEKK